MSEPKQEPVRTLEDLLDELHLVVVEDLLKLIKSGKATASDRQAAAKILKDNGRDETAALIAGNKKASQTPEDQGFVGDGIKVPFDTSEDD